MKIQKLLSLLLALCLLVTMAVGCGEKPAEATTTTTVSAADSSESTTDPTGDSTESTDGTDGVDSTTDSTTTTETGDKTTGENDKTTVSGTDGSTTTTTKKATTKTGGASLLGPGKSEQTTTTTAPITEEEPNVQTTTSSTKKATTATTPTTEKVYGTTMYIDWDVNARKLQVVQKYSDTQDFVSVIKPIAPNDLLQFVSPMTIANTGDDISNDLSAAQVIYSMPESDWLGPHTVNGDWHGGSHGAGGTSTPTAYTSDVVLLVNGKETAGNVGTYAGEVTLSYTNNLFHSSTQVVFMKEYYTLTFDGEKWAVDCMIHFLEAPSSWSTYYGMQCTYGAWMESIAYGNGAPQSLADANGSTKASSWDCDTMTLRGANGHVLEMKLDRTYDLGRGRMLNKATANGAFTSAYPHPNGKAYFLLVSGERHPPANSKYRWRGTYRFFSES